MKIKIHPNAVELQAENTDESHRLLKSVYELQEFRHIPYEFDDPSTLVIYRHDKQWKEETTDGVQED